MECDNCGAQWLHAVKVAYTLDDLELIVCALEAFDGEDNEGHGELLKYTRAKLDVFREARAQGALSLAGLKFVPKPNEGAA